MTRWRDVLAEAFLDRPIEPRFWDRLHEASPPLFRLGLRASVCALWFSPIWFARRPRTFGSLSEDARDALLSELWDHPSWLLRQLLTPMKIAVSFGAFAHPDARAAFPDELVP